MKKASWSSVDLLLKAVLLVMLSIVILVTKDTTSVEVVVNAVMRLRAVWMASAHRVAAQSARKDTS
jgi:hypothetical protein